MRKSFFLRFFIIVVVLTVSTVFVFGSDKGEEDIEIINSVDSEVIVSNFETETDSSIQDSSISGTSNGGASNKDDCGSENYISLWYILAQLMGVVTICFEFWSYQIHNQRKYLLVTSIGNIFWALMFVFIGLHVNFKSIQIMIIAALFGTFRGLIWWWIFGKDTKERRIAGRIVLYASLVIVLFSTTRAIFATDDYGNFVLINRQIIVQCFGLIGGMLFIVGQYLPSKHYLRVFVTFYALMVLLGQTPINLIDDNGETSWNIMGILIETAKIVSVIVFYGRLLMLSKEKND